MSVLKFTFNFFRYKIGIFTLFILHIVIFLERLGDGDDSSFFMRVLLILFLTVKLMKDFRAEFAYVTLYHLENKKGTFIFQFPLFFSLFFFISTSLIDAFLQRNFIYSLLNNLYLCLLVFLIVTFYLKSEKIPIKRNIKKSNIARKTKKDIIQSIFSHFAEESFSVTVLQALLYSAYFFTLLYMLVYRELPLDIGIFLILLSFLIVLLLSRFHVIVFKLRLENTFILFDSRIIQYLALKRFGLILVTSLTPVIFFHITEDSFLFLFASYIFLVTILYFFIITLRKKRGQNAEFI